MPTITIDGNKIDFSQGQTIIEVARAAGIEIPHFCWHPKLSVSGNCRVCLVEIEKMPKLAISCATIASDGMVVHTNSPKTLEARNAVMEFILINHPLDCPICDEAGECKLQEYAFAHSRGESRFDEIKNRKEKRVQLGPRIKFDGERCISCSRCIRFSDEIAKSNQLTFTNRGDKVTISTFPGESFDNPYTLNTTDICPVGALTNEDFRFKSRVWEMSSTKSVCVGCARGCNSEIWVRNNEVLRLTPRLNEEVNSYWMCDKGRLETFKHINAEDRISGTYIRKAGQLQKVEWKEALDVAAKSLRENKSNEIGFVGSALASCEDNYVLLKLAKQMNINITAFTNHIVTGDQDQILIREDKTPNSLGAELIGLNSNGVDLIYRMIKDGKLKALIIVEEDLGSLSEDWEQALGQLDLLIVTSTNSNKTTALADIVFPASTYAEKHGTFVNFQGRVQRIMPAVATEEEDRALDGMSMSRWDKFGTKFDRWMQGRKVDAKPSWKILSLLAAYLGIKMKFDMAEQVFEEISNTIDAFRGLDYDVIGELGAKVKINEKIKI